MSQPSRQGNVLDPVGGMFGLGVDSQLTAGHFNLPLNCDWAWRPNEFYHAGAIYPLTMPQSGAQVGPNTKLFFNGPTPPQGVWARNGASDADPIALGLTLDDFTGDFLSLSFTAPDCAVAGMTKYTLFQCDFVAALDHPATFYLRLNVKYGPSVAKFTQTVETAGGHHCVSFDLGFYPFQVGDFSKLWLDLIIDSPAQNQIVIQDMTLLRHPRGQF